MRISIAYKIRVRLHLFQSSALLKHLSIVWNSYFYSPSLFIQRRSIYAYLASISWFVRKWKFNLRAVKNLIEFEERISNDKTRFDFAEMKENKSNL